MKDPLTEQLHETTRDLPARLRGGPAVRRAASARRQRRRAVILTTAASAVVVAVLVSGNGVDRLLPSTEGPAGSSSTAPTQIPRPSPDPTASTPAGALAGFHFPEEASWRSVPGGVTVKRSNNLRASWALDPCTPTDYPTDSRRVAMATLTRESPDSFDGRQLAIYPDAATAAEVFAGFRRVLAACANRNGVYRFSPVNVGDEALVVWQAYFQGSRQIPGGGYHAIVRDGRAVYLAATGRNLTAAGPGDPAAAALVAGARRLLPLPQ